MAIIALIVTPLAMSIIRKARVSADKRSIDAYGRSIELAIAGYLLDNGKFPTEVSQLTIEYSGDNVACETTQINPDSSIYLAGCKVNNREVTNYTYGTDKSPLYEAYSVGDEVTYNGVDYYVIKDSGVKDNVVTLLKATPLTTDEVNLYGGVGTANNHVNMHVPSNESYYQTAFNANGYGGIAYYGSSTCGYNGSEWISDGCTTDYELSEAKYVIDNWVNSNLSNVFRARLITKDEYELMTTIETYETPTEPGRRTFPMYNWMYNNDYKYWTMTPEDDSSTVLFIVNQDGFLSGGYVGDFRYAVRPHVLRPVVELYKNDGITRKN